MSLRFVQNQRKCSDEHDPVSKRFNRRQNKSNLNQEAVSPANGSSCSGQKTYRQASELLAEPREQVPYDHICRLLHERTHPQSNREARIRFNGRAKTKAVWTTPCALPGSLQIAFDSRTRCVPAVQPCEGRSQELNGDLTWRGVYESARPPITASPHLVQPRSHRFITSFATRDAAARASVEDDG